jgi:hypothetical protein
MKTGRRWSQASRLVIARSEKGVHLTFLGDFHVDHVNETMLSRNMIVNYVQQLFIREDFPREIFVVLADSSVATKGDVVWANMDNEHPYDFVPMPCIDQLVLNLPSKAEFLEAVGARDFTEVDTKSGREFWGQYQFEFASQAQGVRLKWE